MNQLRNRLVRIVCGVLLAAPFVGLPVRGDDGRGDDREIRSAPASNEARPQTPLVEIEVVQSVLGETARRPHGTRFFVSQLRCTNRSDRGIVIPVPEIRLMADGKEFLPASRPQTLSEYTFESGTKRFRFRDIFHPEPLEIAAGATKTAWVTYAGLPRTGGIPSMVLEIPVTGSHPHININDVHRRKLQLTNERIGPRGVLGLLSIAGTLDTINVGALVEELDRLSNQGVLQAVIHFEEMAEPLADLLDEWLEQTAQHRDRAELLAHFPALSSTMSKVHVAAMPGQQGHAADSRDGRQHIHRTAAAAVEWALEPVFHSLSPQEIVDQVERGHPLVRAAALATGGRQLSEAHLSWVLRLTETDDPLLLRGSLLALSEFGQPQAIAGLVQQGRSDTASVATLAVECLAASRFEAGHEALQRLLGEPLSVPLVDLSHILSRYPRARWNDSLRRLATGEWADEGAAADEQSDVRRDALRALGRIGHPELVTVLGEALAAEDPSVRATAFGLLVTRKDATSEQLAVEYALELTRSTFPTQPMLSLFERVRDQRAVPLLVGHLEAHQSDCTLLIKTLAQIGPASIDLTLAEYYETLSPREQATVLTSLTELGSPRAFALAEQGIHSELKKVFHASVNALHQTGSPEAVGILAEVLLETSQLSQVNPLVRALEGIGTDDALNALRRVRYAGDARKGEAIRRRLLDVLQRSPGFQYFVAANDHVQNEQWNDAAEAYGLAIKVDPELSDAYSGRGHCRLHLEQLEPAAADFRQALRSNRYDSLAVTGLGIVMAQEGEVERGIQLVEEASGRFPLDPLFTYNAACVYGRAIETTQDDPPSEERDARIEQLQEKAITLLLLAAERGFNEFEFMRRDPDLAPLQTLEAFQQIGKPPDKKDSR